MARVHQQSGSGAADASSALYQRALELMPGGCSRNTVLRKPHPLYAVRGEGCYVWDIEGVQRIDFANNMASLIHGHCNPEVVAAVTGQLQLGSAYTLATEQEVDYAELLCARNPAFERIRFVNSGTEAVMSCVKAARAYTGRAKIAKLEGAYHGLYDYAEVSQTSAPGNWGNARRPHSVPVAHGTPESALGDVVIIPFNDAATALEILDEHRNDLACVLVDLMPHRVGLRPARERFIQALYNWTRTNDTLLVYDEVITFRSAYGGAQQWFDAEPDLTALGKMIGGGFPVGAVTGRADVMEVMNPLVEPVLFPHSGTFSANPVTMVAGYTAMKLFDEAAVERLNRLGDYARARVSDAIALSDVTACVTGAGSMFRVHMKPRPPVDYREAFMTPEESRRLSLLLDYLFDRGFIMINTCSGTLSTAMGEAEIDRFAETLLDGLRLVRERWKEDYRGDQI
jgi:glutamate-1-semialdehyde 2,1-aminomutase